jgi:hypothetical protein
MSLLGHTIDTNIEGITVKRRETLFAGGLVIAVIASVSSLPSAFTQSDIQPQAADFGDKKAIFPSRSILSM